MREEVVEQLMAEVEKEYAFSRVLPLYMFAWSLAGLGHDRSEPGFYAICRDAAGARAPGTSSPPDLGQRLADEIRRTLQS